MSDLLVRGGNVLTPTGWRPADVEVRAGRVNEIVPRSGADAPARSNLTILDATGLRVAPGLIDLQCNGACGIDLTSAPERLWDVAALLPRWGVTAWLPTIVTSPDEVRTRALAALQAGPSDGGQPVARPLGLHFEGPYLAPGARGAHAEAHLRLPDREAVKDWSHAAGVAVVTLAPELPGAIDVLRDLVDRGVVVSLGHSEATEAKASEATDAGARWVTHLFNAMPPLHHRDPGLVGVALRDERLSVGVIADGLHLHPSVVDLAARLLGPRLTLVTDAVAALGMPPGRVRLGDIEALADDEGVRLENGTLAGSILSMNRAVANFVTFTSAQLDKALAAATSMPARLLDVARERGLIDTGAAGDLVLLDMSTPTSDDPGVRLDVVATVIGGVVAHDRRTGTETVPAASTSA